MSKRTENFGHQTGKSSDKFLSPQNPQTGDGHTRRIVHDQVRLDDPPKDPNK